MHNCGQSRNLYPEAVIVPLYLRQSTKQGGIDMSMGRKDSAGVLHTLLPLLTPKKKEKRRRCEA
jgi:hypothetical protein